jgi:hypothetical protein
MNKNILWTCYPTEKFANSKWETPSLNKKNRLAIITEKPVKTPDDPIVNPNRKGQIVLPSNSLKKLKLTKSSLFGIPLHSKIYAIGNTIFHILDTGKFDPDQFYYLGNLVSDKGKLYVNLIIKNSHNNPITDKYAWTPFNYTPETPTPIPTKTPKMYGLLNTK